MEKLGKKYGCRNLTDEQFEQMIERIMEGQEETLTNMGDIEKIELQIGCLFNKGITCRDTGEVWKVKLI